MKRPHENTLRLAVRGGRTGAHLEHWADGVIVSTLPVDEPANPDDLIADIRELQACWHASKLGQPDGRSGRPAVTPRRQPRPVAPAVSPT